MQSDAITKRLLSAFAMGLLLTSTQGAQALESDEIDAKERPKIEHRSHSRQRDHSHRSVKRQPSGMLGTDTIPFWTAITPNADSVYYFGDPASWTTTLVGSSPFTANSREDEHSSEKRTTVINAPIIPITVELLDYDGTVRIYKGKRMIMSADKSVQDAVNSPIFSPATFDPSEPPTQYGDAIMRANFSGAARGGWHTLLKADPKPGITLRLPRGSYRFSVYPDGNLAGAYVTFGVLNPMLFPAGDVLGDLTTVIGTAEALGYMKPSDITTFLLPNLTPCSELVTFSDCWAGFHSVDFETGDKTNGWKNRQYVYNFSNWFGEDSGTWANSYVLSHEIAEIFNDPFLTSVVPWWQSPDGYICANWVEVGDVIEVTDPGFQAQAEGGKTYSVANVALLPWFMRGDADFIGPSPSYSFPDRSLLTSPSAVTKRYCNP